MTNSTIYSSNADNSKSSNNLILERTKSQLIKPIYYFNTSKIDNDSLNESKDLASSKISQVTFSKPSEFITNSSNSNFYVDSAKFINSSDYINSSTKIVLTPPQKV